MIMNRFILFPSDRRFYCLNGLVIPMFAACRFNITEKYPILPDTAGSGVMTGILSANPEKGITFGTD